MRWGESVWSLRRMDCSVSSASPASCKQMISPHRTGSLVPGTLTSKDLGGWAFPSGVEVTGRDETSTGWGCHMGRCWTALHHWVPYCRGGVCLTEEGESDPESAVAGERQATAGPTNYLFPSSLPGLFLGPLSALSRKGQTPVLPSQGSAAPSSLLLSSHPAQKILYGRIKTGVTKITP